MRGFLGLAQIGMFGGPVSAFDSDAASFFTRAGITDPTQRTAVNTFVVGLKSANLWALHDVIYPFVGGTAASHSHNLKSASNQITWDGAITHNASGVQGNGTSGYGDTNYFPSTGSMTQNSASFTCYVNAADAAGGAAMGTPTAAAAIDVYQFFSNLSGTTSYYAAFGTNTGKVQGAHSGANTGNFTGTRTSAGAIGIARNGSMDISDSGASESTPPGAPVFILARYDGGTPQAFSSGRYALMMFGSGLTLGQCITLNNLVQAYQTALGRA